MKYEDCKVQMKVSSPYGDGTIVALGDANMVIIRSRCNNYFYNVYVDLLIPLNEIKENEMSMLSFDENKNYTLEGLGAVYKFTGYTFEPTDSSTYASVQLDANGKMKFFFNEEHRSSRTNSKFLNKTMQEAKKYKVAYKTHDSEWLISEKRYESIEAFIEYTTALNITQAYLLKD